MSSLICTFTANSRLYGLPIEEVQELLKPHTVTPIPLTRREILGLINLRGQVVPCVDLRVALGHPAREASHSFMNVVARTNVGPVALAVDAISDVVEVNASQIETVPDTVNPQQRPYIVSACKLPERILLVLNLSHIIRISEALTSAQK
jgi:purine-binding chemotaxis protein CheW